MPRRVGFGKAEITPSPPVSLAGFGTPQHATEVHDPLEARAVFIDEDGVTVCLVVCDLLGMSAAFAGPARETVATALGLPPAAVLIACTHTHSAPSAMEGTAALGWETPEGFGEIIAAGCRDAAMAASAAALPATLSWRRAPLPPDVSLNRRGHPYEPTFSVLEAVGTGGTRIGSLSNLAIHPVALGPECLAVSADWVGPFRQAVEAHGGGTALMLSGALGDVNPSHVHRQNNDCRHDGFEEAARLGADVAEAVDAALKDVEPLEGPLRIVARRTLDVPIGGTGLAAARGSSTMTVELLEWAVGPLRIVSVPGEAFHAFGRRVDDSRGNITVLAGLAPEWMGYLPVPYEEGGYEEGVSYGPAAVEAILAALLSKFLPDLGHYAPVQSHSPGGTVQESDVREYAEAHAKAVVAGDQGHVMGDLDPAAMAKAGPVVGAMPQPATSAEVVKVNVSGEQALVHIKYDGDDKSATIESTWAERDGRPKIIDLSVV